MVLILKTNIFLFLGRRLRKILKSCQDLWVSGYRQTGGYNLSTAIRGDPSYPKYRILGCSMMYNAGYIVSHALLEVKFLQGCMLKIRGFGSITL